METLYYIATVGIIPLWGWAKQRSWMASSLLKWLLTGGPVAGLRLGWVAWLKPACTTEPSMKPYCRKNSSQGQHKGRGGTSDLPSFLAAGGDSQKPAEWGGDSSFFGDLPFLLSAGSSRWDGKLLPKRSHLTFSWLCGQEIGDRMGSLDPMHPVFLSPGHSARREGMEWRHPISMSSGHTARRRKDGMGLKLAECPADPLASLQEEFLQVSCLARVFWQPGLKVLPRGAPAKPVERLPRVTWSFESLQTVPLNACLLQAMCSGVSGEVSVRSGCEGKRPPYCMHILGTAFPALWF